jgi:RNA binding exosome subunit
MKPLVYFLAIGAILLFSIPSHGQINITNTLNTLNQSLGQGLSNDKIVDGLKEALSKGTNTSSTKASALDGFYGNSIIRIPFPSEAQEMQKTLVKMGMEKQTEDFVRSLNRAAEDASKKAAPIFLNAIKTMSISDGVNILRGDSVAATKFLQNKTTEELKLAFAPIVKSSLESAQVYSYWKPLAKTYNRIPMVKRVNPNMEEYVTTKAIEGLFKLISQEETKIRKDPAATGSALIMEVFGKRP